jgi:hypothetical protein
MTTPPEENAGLNVVPPAAVLVTAAGFTLPRDKNVPARAIRREIQSVEGAGSHCCHIHPADGSIDGEIAGGIAAGEESEPVDGKYKERFARYTDQEVAAFS